MFGFVRGAFTGATKSSEGLVGEADGGTLFLDEVGEMDPDLQKQLLRFIQEGVHETQTEDLRFRAADDLAPNPWTSGRELRILASPNTSSHVISCN